MFTSVLPTAPAAVFPKSPRSRPERATSPGPAYDISAGLTATMRRSPGASFGSSPRASLAARQQCEASPSDYPQPPALGPHTVRSTMPGSPAYTLKARARSSPAAPSPSPQDYAVPALVGGGLRGPFTARAFPAFSLRPRTSDAPPQSLLTPAPGHYGNPSDAGVRAGSPAFSLRSRYGGLAPSGAPVGPGEYFPAAAEQASAQHGAASPRFSLRPRTVDPAEEAAQRRSPGPAGYGVPASLGATALWPNPGGTGFAFTARPVTPARAPSPGPADYDTRPATPGRSALSTSRNASNPSSAATWGGRTAPQLAPPHPSATPPTLGPNSHALPSVFEPGDKSHFKASGGGYSLSPRRLHGSPMEAPLRSTTPAPDAYGAPGRPLLAHPQPRFGVGARLPPGPPPSLCGPGAPVSDAATARAAPAFSLRSRSASPCRSADALGPAAFNLQGGSPAVQPAPPSWSMRIRWRPPRGPADAVPGPGAYGMVQLPHLALLMARTEHFGLPSSDSVRRTNPQLYGDYSGIGSGVMHQPAAQQCALGEAAAKALSAAVHASSSSSRAAGGSPGAQQDLPPRPRTSPATLPIARAPQRA